MSDALVTDDPQGQINDIVMAKSMAEALHRAYPGHFWAVAVDGKAGLADVRNLALSGNWGFRLKLNKIYSASAFEKDVIRAGGEILERFRLSRGRLDEDALASTQQDFAGRLMADVAR